ncbi:hypothetical protein [Actinomadura sp. 7K534]|uniref:hypothetical protein n=1 Tax=Actinomadura sp. 7K534 TaxID=2530366 RepID=UPI001046B908|nr:hypothetical protein [Actinomadura sp. 7K534]TDB85515.1 hypothetical protein E1266_35420 [Actinomadura sp. 7K534]
MNRMESNVCDRYDHAHLSHCEAEAKTLVGLDEGDAAAEQVAARAGVEVYGSLRSALSGAC